MTWQMVLVFGLLAGTFALMVWEKFAVWAAGVRWWCYALCIVYLP